MLGNPRFAVRQFVRTRGFTVTAVLVLELGIGATTAILSAVRAVALRPLPFAQADRLYMPWESDPEKGWERETASAANYLDRKAMVASFADVEAYDYAPAPVTITGLVEPLVLDYVAVTGGFFSMLGVRPTLGRDFTDAETWAEATWRAGETPLLLSARTWRTISGGEASAVGRAVKFNDLPARVVGVMPDGFAFPSGRRWTSGCRSVGRRRIEPIARLAPGATPERARAELATVPTPATSSG